MRPSKRMRWAPAARVHVIAPTLIQRVPRRRWMVMVTLARCDSLNLATVPSGTLRAELRGWRPRGRKTVVDRCSAPIRGAVRRPGAVVGAAAGAGAGGTPSLGG